MIFVDNLDNLHKCPNCGGELEGWYNLNTEKKSKYCSQCESEYFQKEQDLTVFHVDLTEESSKNDKIDSLIADIEYELHTYEMMSSTQHELLRANCMRGIIEKLLDVIKEIK